MAYFCRSFVGANSLVRTSVSRFPLIQSRHVVLKATPAQPPKAETFEERNMRLKRPMSPHLAIYKPQLTSLLSVTHRATGIALSVYAFAFAGLSMSPGSFPHMVEAVQSLHIAAPIIFSGKLILAFPAAYHLCNGVRHLVWDFAKALTIKEVYTTGYIMCGATVVLSFLLAAM